jgi:DNA-binding transcriptional MerR regulator
VGEYRIEELAAKTDTTVRTLQAYRNRGMLQPPRRQGRIALYSDEHVARLELVASLLSRGYSLNAVGELLAGLGRGDRIEDLLGLNATIEQAAQGPATVVSVRELQALFGDRASGLAELERLGILTSIETDDDEDERPGDRRYRVELSSMLSAGAALTEAGVPIEAVIDEGVRLERDIDEIARRFVHLALDHVIEGGAVRSAGHAATITDLVTGLVPYASAVVDEYLRVALQRHIKEAIREQLDGLLEQSHRDVPDT